MLVNTWGRYFVKNKTNASIIDGFRYRNMSPLLKIQAIICKCYIDVSFQLTNQNISGKPWPKTAEIKKLKYFETKGFIKKNTCFNLSICKCKLRMTNKNWEPQAALCCVTHDRQVLCQGDFCGKQTQSYQHWCLTKINIYLTCHIWTCDSERKSTKFMPVLSFAWEWKSKKPRQMDTIRALDPCQSCLSAFHRGLWARTAADITQGQ